MRRWRAGSIRVPGGVGNLVRMEIDEALAQARHALEALDRAARSRPALSGQDVFVAPFFYAADKGRAEITRRVFRHWARVADELGARVIGVGSEGKVSRGLWCEVFDDIDYHEYPQCWRGSATGAGSVGLRAKFDEAIRRARIFNPERVFIGGSDDIIPADWFRAAWKSSADLVGVKGGAWVVEYRRVGSVPGRRVVARRIESPLERDPRIMEWDGRYGWAPDIEFCGGGVVMGREMLDDWGWAPFRDPSCEIGVERRAREEGWRVEAIEGRFFAVKAEGAVLNDAGRSNRIGARPAQPTVITEWRETWGGLA